MTWGLNMGYDDAQNAINMAKSVMKTFNNGNQAGNTGVFLDLLELGLNRNFLGSSLSEVFVQATRPIFSIEKSDPPTGQSRNTSQSVYNYLPDSPGSDFSLSWIKLMTPVVEVVDLSPGGPISVQACSFVGQGFRPSEAFEAGLLDSAPGKLVTL